MGRSYRQTDEDLWLNLRLWAGNWYLAAAYLIGGWGLVALAAALLGAGVGCHRALGEHRALQDLYLLFFAPSCFFTWLFTVLLLVAVPPPLTFATSAVLVLQLFMFLLWKKARRLREGLVLGAAAFLVAILPLRAVRDDERRAGRLGRLDVRFARHLPIEFYGGDMTAVEYLGWRVKHGEPER